MKTLFKYINDINYDISIYEDVINMINEDILISEKFQSSLLSNLAKRIYAAEKQFNKSEIEATKRRNETYTYKTKPHLRSFSSFFGPLTVTDKYGKRPQKVQGLKWAEIKDDDFIKYDGDDKELLKLLKNAYANKCNADFIVCKKGTTDIVYVIQAYAKDDHKKFFKFVEGEKWGNGFKEQTTQAYKYQSRALKINEVIPLISEYDVYALEIKPEMIQDYKGLINQRTEDQKGIINYDVESLNALLKEQKARYRKLADEIRANKLMSDPNILFDDIKKVQEEATNLVKLIIDTPEYIDKFYNAGDLMYKVSYCWKEFYDYAKYQRNSDKAVSKAKANGEANPHVWGKWDRSSAEQSINKAKEYLDEIKKLIKEYKDNL